MIFHREWRKHYHSFQMLSLSDIGRETQDELQGKMLLHTEYSLLSLLHGQPGVVHHHGLFKVSQLTGQNLVHPTVSQFSLRYYSSPSS